MQIFNAETIEFDAFMPVNADYGPRDIKAVAAMVTEHNIGQWALEFQTDLNHPGPQNTAYFKFTAERFEDDSITLTMKPGVWIVKIWEELHIFQDGMFQKTFTVPKEQLRAVRWSTFNKSIELEKEWEEERKLERSAAEQMMEERLTQAEETGDWSHLTEGERYVLKVRLLENEEIQALIAAAKERAAKKVGPDYHAGSLFKSEGQDPDFYEKDTATIRREQEDRRKLDLSGVIGPDEERILLGAKEKIAEAETTQFIPQVSIPIGLDPTVGEHEVKPVPHKRPIYPEGDEPTGGNTRGVGN